MAITRIGSGTGGNGTATSVSITVPANVKPGDILVWQQYVESTGAITPQFGYTSLLRISNTTASNTFDGAIYWKRLTTTESGSHTFSHPSAWTAAAMVVYRGCVPLGIPIDTSSRGIVTTVNGTTCNAGPILPTRSGNQIVAGFGFAGSLTGPTGMFEVVNFADLVFSELNPAKALGAGTGIKTISGTSQALGTIMFQLIDAQEQRRRIAA